MSVTHSIIDFTPRSECHTLMMMMMMMMCLTMTLRLNDPCGPDEVKQLEENRSASSYTHTHTHTHRPDQS